MTAVLTSMGLSEKIHDRIPALYSNPCVRLRSMVTYQTSFQYATAPDRALSLIIFVLSRKLFLRSIHSNWSIKGIRIQEKVYQIAAYANMSLFLSDLLTPLCNVDKALKLLRSISHLKMNCTKSCALNVTLPQKEVYNYQLAFLFTWKCDIIRYLGIQLLSDINKLYVRNFCPYLKWNNVAFGHGVSHPGPRGPCR